MSSELIPAPQNYSLSQGAMPLDDFQRMLDELKKMVADTLVQADLAKGITGDYGVIPGTGNKSHKVLLKPGAEKVLQRFNLTKRFEVVDRVVTEQLISFDIKCIVSPMSRPELVLAECIANCNSHETKYRYRWLFASEVPSDVDRSTLPQQERTKRGGGGKYIVYKMDNPNPFDDYNTILKMAQKRALVGAALLATNISDEFTQDLEHKMQPAATPAPAKRPPAKKPPPEKSLQERADQKARDEVIDVANDWITFKPEVTRVCEGYTKAGLDFEVIGREIAAKMFSLVIAGIEKGDAPSEILKLVAPDGWPHFSDAQRTQLTNHLDGIEAERQQVETEVDTEAEVV